MQNNQPQEEAAAEDTQSSEPQQEKVVGTVKWYDPHKGYGFIDHPEGSDVFVHANNLGGMMNLNEGDEVSYTVEKTEKGLSALNVEKVE